jgi:hypothetical protein
MPLQLAGRLPALDNAQGGAGRARNIQGLAGAGAPAAGRASSSVRVWLRIFSLRFRCCDCFAGPASFSACARRARAPQH